MRFPAPAKINLHLRVGKAGADGFHPLLTWMCTAALFDNLTLVRGAASPRRDEQWFTLSCDQPELPTDSRNLVVRVATALADTLSRDGEGPTGRRERVSAFLSKRIPAGAGLGGGSSDAATTLMALARMWKLDWSPRRLSDFAAQFGSDLSFFFFGPSSICTGRGEIVRPIDPPAAKFAVLVLAKIAMPTPDVYRQFDQMRLGSDAAIADEPDWKQWTGLAADELLPRLINDLEAPAFALRPELGELRTALERELKKQVRMSGSGSCLFTLCDEQEQADEIASRAASITGSVAGAKAIAVRLAPALNMYVADAEKSI